MLRRIVVQVAELGPLSLYPKRRSFCEGNHVTKVLVRSRPDSEPTEEYSLDLDLSRPSVFLVHQYQREESGAENCGSRRGCWAEMSFDLSGLDRTM